MIPKIARQDIAQRRYDICKSCKEFSGIKTCKLCNCFMPVKVKFAHVGCPHGKWMPEMDISNQQVNAYKDLE